MANSHRYLLFAIILVFSFPTYTFDWFIEEYNEGTELQDFTHVPRDFNKLTDRGLEDWYLTCNRLLALAEADQIPPPPLHPDTVFQELLAKQVRPINWSVIPEVGIEDVGHHYVLNPEAIALWSIKINGTNLPQGDPGAIQQTTLEGDLQTAQKENVESNHQTVPLKLLRHNDIFSTLASVLESTLAPDSCYIHHVSGLNYGENPYSDWHSFYTKNLIGALLGLTWKPRVGPNGDEVCPLLLRSSIEDSIKIFYSLIDFDELLSTLVFRLNNVVLPMARYEFTTLSTDYVLLSTAIDRPQKLGQKMKRIQDFIQKQITRAEVINFLVEMGILQKKKWNAP